MKLLICITCSDVRALRIGKWTRCDCKRSRARYRDQIIAEVSGNSALLLGFRNDSLTVALKREIADRKANLERDLGHEFMAFVIPRSSPHMLMRKAAARRSEP